MSTDSFSFSIFVNSILIYSLFYFILVDLYLMENVTARNPPYPSDFMAHHAQHTFVQGLLHEQITCPDIVRAFLLDFCGLGIVYIFFFISFPSYSSSSSLSWYFTSRMQALCYGQGASMLWISSQRHNGMHFATRTKPSRFTFSHCIKAEEGTKYSM